MLQECGISLSRIGSIANEDGYKPMSFQLLNGACPSPAFFKIGRYDQSRVRQGIDDFVALHGMAHIESGRGIVGRNQDQFLVHQRFAIISREHSTLETVRHDARDHTACL